MSTAKPRFSIVLPTRNRAHLLRHALQSALAQTYDDFEIVVSNNDSSDDTERVTQSFNDARVRYFRTSETLPMSRNWEFALSHTRGEYVTYLCDDDAIVPSLLARLAALLDESDRDVIYWNSVAYFHESWFERRKRNHLMIAPLVNHVTIEESRTVLRDVFQLQHYQRDFPKMLNSCISRQLIDEVMRKNGQFFQISCPDYSTITTVSALTREMTYLHTPLMLAGVGSESIGAANRRRMTSDASKQFWGEHTAENAIRWEAPLKQASVTNAIADTILRTKGKLGDSARHVNLNLPIYFVLCRSEIEDERRLGGDVSELMRAWQEALQRQPTPVQSETLELWTEHAKGRHRTLSSRIKESMFSWIPSRLLSSVSAWQNLNGKSAGFANAAEAAACLDKQLPPVHAHLNAASFALASSESFATATSVA